MKLSSKQIKFARLSYEDELTDGQIAKECGITDRTVYRWRKKEEIQQLIDQLAEVDVRKAKKKLERASLKAAQTLADCLTCGEPETCRKAACDILESTELKKEPGAINIKIIDKKLEVVEGENES